MQLKDTTLKVLQNFSAINSNLVVRKGNNIKTMTEARNVVSSATVDQEFDRDFGIYDLNEFLGVLNLVDTPALTFADDYVTISDTSGRTKIKYFFSDADILTTPSNDVKMPNADVTFTLDADTLAKLKRAASALGHESLAVEPDGGSLKLSIFDNNNNTSNTYSTSIAGDYPEQNQFKLIFNINNFKVIPGDYNVSISSKLVSEFKHATDDVRYWIALEKTSEWN
ncbi:hypothetical protein N9B98_04340 [bacterium]|nr:hypothetical protein [bacterium]